MKLFQDTIYYLPYSSMTYWNKNRRERPVTDGFIFAILEKDCDLFLKMFVFYV